MAAIKHELIGLMISVPPSIQSQLGEAIGVIADSDFWERWDTLVDVGLPLRRHFVNSRGLTSGQDLVARLMPDSPATNNGVLQVAHSIFKRWRPLYRSDELYTEINHVLSKFGNPFLSLLEVRRRNLYMVQEANHVNLRAPTGSLRATHLIRRNYIRHSVL